MMNKLKEIIHLAAALAEEITEGCIKGCNDCSFFHSCIDCVNFDEKNELCKIAKARPPARVIVYGCDSWFNPAKADDDIPF